VLAGISGLCGAGFAHEAAVTARRVATSAVGIGRTKRIIATDTETQRFAAHAANPNALPPKAAGDVFS
jgi:hypothetical protein